VQDAAIALVEDPSMKNHFLWVKRHDVPVWVLPGGGIDEGETPELACVREVFEESGLKVAIERKTAQYSPINKWTATTHIFLCKWVSGVPNGSEESVEVGFFDVDHPPHVCFPLHVIWMKEALANPNAVVKRPLNEFTWQKVGLFFLNHPIILLKYLLASLFRS
jgi:8-oxo-dGTP pyrophosphatase MutT (NUDIX family)